MTSCRPLPRWISRTANKTPAYSTSQQHPWWWASRLSFHNRISNPAKHIQMLVKFRAPGPWSPSPQSPCRSYRSPPPHRISSQTQITVQLPTGTVASSPPLLAAEFGGNEGLEYLAWTLGRRRLERKIHHARGMGVALPARPLPPVTMFVWTCQQSHLHNSIVPAAPRRDYVVAAMADPMIM